MVQLSVNVNKVATLRNSRGGETPSVLDSVQVCIDAGAPGITVHPREDARHIRRADVLAIAALLHRTRPDVELNLEGDPRPDWIELVHEVQPTQATLVPVRPGEITSEAGWSQQTDLRAIVADLQTSGARVSLFVDAELPAVEWAANMGANRIELYTEPYAAAFACGPEQGTQTAAQTFDAHCACAERAHALGLGINAGHDLDLENLPLYKTLPNLAEVSIGHAIISRAVFVGLDRVVREYLELLTRTGP